VQACVVEEVVEELLARPAAGRLDDEAGWNGVPVEDIADDRSDPDLGACLDQVADLCLERRVAAFVIHQLRLTHPNGRAVRGGVEAKHDPLPYPPRRDVGAGLVPDIADVVACLGFGEDIVEARRDWDLARARERLLPPTLPSALPVGI
jgi:hypothetical protein